MRRAVFAVVLVLPTTTTAADAQTYTLRDRSGRTTGTVTRRRASRAAHKSV